MRERVQKNIAIMIAIVKFRRKVSNMCRLLLMWSLLLAAVAIMIPAANAEYENTWNFYYEQPCCGPTAAALNQQKSGPGQHHSHRGKAIKRELIFFVF